MDTGKFGKLKGDKHPRDLRKIDPEPMRTTPKAKPKHKPVKQYGYEYTIKWPWEHTGRKRRVWFETRQAREQSMAAHNRNRPLDWYSDAVAIERGTDNG